MAGTIGIVAYQNGGLVPGCKGIVNQMDGQVDVGTFFYSFPHPVQRAGDVRALGADFMPQEVPEVNVHQRTVSGYGIQVSRLSDVDTRI